MEIKYMSRQEVAEKLDMKTCISLMENVFMGFAKGEIKNILRSVAPLPGGVLGVMPGVIPKDKTAGAKLITVIHDNSKRNLPSHQGIVAVFNSEDGTLKGVCDGTSITAIRTGAVSGLATKYMAREDAKVLCLIGGGVQAEQNLDAVMAVRPIQQVNIWCRNPEKAAEFVKKHSRRYPGVKFTPFSDCSKAVEDADVICTVTPGKEIVLKGRWVKPGAHINAVGACAAAEREADGECVAKSRFFGDSIEAVKAESGEYLLAKKDGLIDESHILGDLADIVSGKKKARESKDDITMFESLGLAEEDIICADYLLKI